MEPADKFAELEKKNADLEAKLAERDKTIDQLKSRIFLLRLEAATAETGFTLKAKAGDPGIDLAKVQ